MTCSISKSRAHNKRIWPDKDKVNPPSAKKGRGRGRPRNDASSSSSRPDTATSSQSVLNATPHPTRVGRGGRVITSGRGSRGGGRGGGRTGSRAGKGQRSRVPRGIGILFDNNGNAFSNVPGSSTGPVNITPENGPCTQASTNQA
ncbi:hypothetical protein vseg_011424 [Gypsophila vaccaria]